MIGSFSVILSGIYQDLLLSGVFRSRLYVLGLPNLYHPRDCVDSFDRQKLKDSILIPKGEKQISEPLFLQKRINAEAIAGMRGVEAERARLMIINVFFPAYGTCRYFKKKEKT